VETALGIVYVALLIWTLLDSFDYNIRAHLYWHAYRWSWRLEQHVQDTRTYFGKRYREVVTP
jgi:ABC-type cobalamin transport system permease subunit